MQTINENENFCKAIEQAVVLPCAKEMQLISDEKCDFSSDIEEGSAD